MKKGFGVRTLTESAILIALSVVLSLIKIAELPYGGSITVASMVPIVILAYRNGVLVGLLGGFSYGVIQQLLGLNNLSYVTGWQSVVAVIALDYLLAFGVIGLGGIYRRVKGLSSTRSITLGILTVCVMRYALHTIAGCTVWAGLSIPTEAAFIYSLGYNATYMIPETIISCFVGAYLASALDFEKAVPVRRVSSTGEGNSALRRVLAALCAIIPIGALVYALTEIFPKLQEPEDGSFTLAYLADIRWVAVSVVLAVCIFISIGIISYLKLSSKKEN